MTEKVEELLHVIGPFYEIVEDKKSGKSSDLTSGWTVLRFFSGHGLCTRLGQGGLELIVFLPHSPIIWDYSMRNPAQLCFTVFPYLSS